MPAIATLPNHALIRRDPAHVPTAMSRRAIGSAILAATAAVASGCGHSRSAHRPRSVDKVTFLTAFGTNGRDSYAHVARAKGFFAEAGIQVTIQPGRAGDYNHQLLAAGQVQFASVDAAGALVRYALGKDTTFRIIAGIQQRTLVSIITMDATGISTPKDLAGKTLGAAPGAVPQTLFPAYARLTGIDPATVRWTNAPQEQLPTLLVGGKIQGAGLFLVARPGVEAAAHGRKAVVLPYGDVLADLYGAALVAQKSTIATNPDLTRRFTRALLRGLAYAVSHPDESAEILHRAESAQDPRIAAAELTLMKPYVLPGNDPVGVLDPTRAAQNIALLKSVGLIPADTAPGIAEQIIDMDTVSAVTVQ